MDDRAAERERMVENVKLLAFLKDINRVQAKHKHFLKTINQWRRLKPELRVSDVNESIRALRAELREANPTSRIQNLMRISWFLRSFYPLKSLVVQFGKPDAYGHRRSPKITVGYMWQHKVEAVLYTGHHEFGDWIILSAEQVKVNSAIMMLYEVLAYNVKTLEKSHGYVAQSKTKKKYTAFGKTASIAIRAAESMLGAEIDELLSS